jgi:non-canonical purine NTP pyrophosphatase (RdgB/HAM1 family)
MQEKINEIYFATSSKSRLASAKTIFWKKDIVIKPLPRNYIEIQAKSGKEIAKATAIQASREYRMPVIREYKSLTLDALPGFPGHYLNHFHKTINPEKLIEILENKSRKGKFIIDTVLALPNGEIIETKTELPIKISKYIKGKIGNWEKLIMLKESDKTFSESIEKKDFAFNELWDRNLKEISEKIKN